MTFKKGYKQTAEHKRKVIETKKKLYAEGKITVWNKGLTKETDERLKNISQNNKSKIWENQEEIVKLYKDELLNDKEIGKIYGCSSQPIRDILKKNSAFIGISERRKLLSKAGKLKIWNKDLSLEDLRVKNNMKKLQEWDKKKTGKKYEELYGKEKAKKIKAKLSVSNSIAKLGEKNPMFGKKQTKNWLEMRKNLIIPMNDTYIELKSQGFLKQLNIEFLAHYYVSEIIHAYQCDILINPQPNFMVERKTILETDGDYWHCNPKKYKTPINQMQKDQMEEDACRNEELRAAGFNVIRLWESDIKKMTLEDFKEILFKKSNKKIMNIKEGISPLLNKLGSLRNAQIL